MLFHVRKHEDTFDVKFSLLDWDKLTGNDFIGDVTFPLKTLLEMAPKPDPVTGVYADGVETTQDMVEYTLPLNGPKDSRWEAKHSPRLTIRAKYQPYDALRQRFWRQYLQQYDLDESRKYSRIELQSMLDSLGSTLTKSTIDNFFTQHGKNPETDELNIDEAIMALERAMARPMEEKPVVSNEPTGLSTGATTPNLQFNDLPTVEGLGQQLELTGLDAPSEKAANLAMKGEPLPEAFRESNQRVLPGQGVPSRQGSLVPDDISSSLTLSVPSRSSTLDVESDLSASQLPSTERVINIKTCPLCHKPRVSNRAETDMVTHLAVCASSDWNRVNRLVVGNYVTASQAQRKWATNVVTKVSSGAYQLGANSANIIVQNRITGQLEEEKMQAFVRLGIRLLYKRASSRLEGKRARNLLKSMSVKQGIKYDSTESAKEIPAFIEFHNLNMNEVLDPLDSFKTFNQFFYRKLKPDARPVASPEDPTVLVSGADCRMMAFPTIQQATKLWIKGREFTLPKLLGPQYAHEAPNYEGGSLVIFRLAPQDYHRYHSPVDGKIGTMTYISGEYYTVNPQAVRSNLDIYGENARKIVPIDSTHFGRVFAVCVGAMMVGSIISTVKEGDVVARGQEFGYFAFGGSTIVLLFEKGAVQFDEDLVTNGQACLETLVRVGMQIGKSTRAAR
ncbi:hypothetical protein DL93DRAFT_2071450 [Clavulina sp. PMI_390]|nr:hypothetical protein DL93DRAFT_2071450 [Clavulina sp. PMI_390]